MALLVDLSNYPGPLRGEQARGLLAEGFTGAIVQAVDPPAGYPPDVAAQQLATLRAEGVTNLQGYVVWWFGNTPDYLGPLLDTLEAGGVTTCWLDIEDARPANNQMTVAQRTEEVRAAIGYIEARGLHVGIYTAHCYWTAYMVVLHRLRVPAVLGGAVRPRSRHRLGAAVRRLAASTDQAVPRHHQLRRHPGR